MEVTMVRIMMNRMFLHLHWVGNNFQVNVSFDVTRVFEDGVTTSVLHEEQVWCFDN